MATQGEWGGLQIRFDLPEIQEFADTASSVFQLVNAALDLALTVLSIVKAFVSGILNPIRQIIQELVSLLRNLLLDFRRLGVYAHTGDLALLNEDSTQSRIKGGYAAYERRMVSRLTNRADLTRPDFSSSNTVLALFFYAGQDLSFINGLLDPSQLSRVGDLIRSFARLFGLDVGTGNTLPTPINVAPNYGTASSYLSTGGGVSNLMLTASALAGKNSVSVQWNLAPSDGATDTATPVVPPSGFLVEVSCFPQGLYAGWLAPVEAGTGGPSEGEPQYTAGLYLDGGTGEPLRIFGGTDSVRIGTDVAWSNAFNGGALLAGATPMYFLESPTSTKFLQSGVITKRETDGRYINQRTFYVDTATVRAQSWVGGTFALNIPVAELPLKAVPDEDGAINASSATTPEQVYVRICSCDKTVTGPKDFKWDIVPRRTARSERVSPINNLTVGARGIPSDITTVMLPRPDVDLYLQGIQAALTLALLSRSDLLPPDVATLGAAVPATITASGYHATGLESVSTGLVPIVMSDVRRYFRVVASPVEFSADLLTKVSAMADFLIGSQGNLPAPLLSLLGPRLRRLTTWKWSDTTLTGVAAAGVRGNAVLSGTLLDALAQGTGDTETVPCLVTKNLGSLSTLEGGVYPAANHLARETPLVARYNAGTFGKRAILDVSHQAPILQDGTTGGYWYVRDVVPQQIYDDAQAVLQLAGVAQTAPEAGSWVAWRPFVGVDSNLAGMNGVVATIEQYASTLDTGLRGSAEAITAVISALEQRVREVQELIRRIEEYLAIPLSIEVPDAVFLPLLVSGTDGVVAGLMGAANKPTDGPQAYAGGVALVAGIGVPSIVTDLLMLALTA